LALNQLAKSVGISPEMLLQASIENWLDNSQQDFAQASSYVIKKNAELYKRLA
jgi:hypothetical protein